MDYKNGKIYRVVCSETDRQYIGSTCSTLVKRLYNHKHKNKNGNGCMTKDFIEPKIFLIEDYPCERKEQLLMRERFYMESMECVNMIRPIVTKEEKLQDHKNYNKKNKEIINQKGRDEYQKNIEKELIRSKKNREKFYEKRTQKFECDCGGTYSYTGKSRHIKTKKHQAYLSSIV